MLQQLETAESVRREVAPRIAQELYEAAEGAAKAGKRGLWRDTDPMPPWEFRHSKIKTG